MGERVTLPDNRKAYVICIGGAYYLRDEQGQPVECDMREWWADIATRTDWRAANRERMLHNYVSRTLREARYTPAELQRQSERIYPDGHRSGD